MTERELVTRSSLRRELVVNAATKPVALAVGVTVAVAAFVLGAQWLLIAAVALYFALALATFFDDDEAARVGKAAYERARLTRSERPLPVGLDNDLALLLARARREELNVRQAIADLGLPFDDVSIEVDTMIAEMERIAKRAQGISDYLRVQPAEDVRRRLHALRRSSNPSDAAATTTAQDRAIAALTEQLRVRGVLESELAAFRAEMEHLIASLGVIHGEIVRMSAAGDRGEQADVAARVRDLRRRVGELAEGMDDAAAQLEQPIARDQVNPP